MRSMTKHMDSVVIESNRDRIVDESILGELEFYKEKVILLERDIQSLLDEKEELIVSRDEMSLKNDRLNEHLLSMMRNLSGQSGYTDGNSHSYDVDALYLENRYLLKVNNVTMLYLLLYTGISKIRSRMKKKRNVCYWIDWLSTKI